MKLIEEKWKEGTVYEALVLADTTPDTLPTSGRDVDGMNDAHTFAPMSILYVADPGAAHKVYVADESGKFIAQ